MRAIQASILAVALLLQSAFGAGATTPITDITGLGSGVSAALQNAINSSGGLLGVTNNYLPGLSSSVLGSGVPGLADGHWFISGRPGVFDNFNALRLERIIPNGASGPGGNRSVYSAFWVFTQAPESDASNEWGVNSSFDNYSLVTTGSANVASSGVINKRAASGNVGYSAGGHFVCNDQQGLNDPTGGCIGAEIGVGSSTATTDAGNNRRALLINAGGVSGAWVGMGIQIGTNSGVNLKSAITFDQGAGTTHVGLDLSGITFANTPIGCAAGQCLGFDMDPSTKAVNRKLYYSSGRLIYRTSGNDNLQFGDDGAIYTNGNIWLPAATLNTAGNLFLGGDTSQGYSGLRLFSIGGSSYVDSRVSSVSQSIHFRIDTAAASTDRLAIYGDGRIAVGAVSTPSATLDIEASTTTRASLRIRDGSAPTTPNNGDLWQDGTHLYARINGSTKQLDN